MGFPSELKKVSVMKNILRLLAMPLYLIVIVLSTVVFWIQTFLIKVEKWVEKFIF
jgi:hypothetical protein